MLETSLNIWCLICNIGGYYRYHATREEPVGLKSKLNVAMFPNTKHGSLPLCCCRLHSLYRGGYVGGVNGNLVRIFTYNRHFCI